MGEVMDFESPLALQEFPTLRLFIDPGWKPLLTKITTLKDALDHAFRWQGGGGNEAWINAVLRQHGLDLDDFQDSHHTEGPHTGDFFVQMLLGPEFHMRMSEELGQDIKIPPWAVLGWVRLDGYRETPSRSLRQLKEAARDVNSRSANVYTSFWSGFPLFLAEEGKNRTQLHRLAGLHRRAVVGEMPFPALKGFVARPVPFFPWAVSIRSELHPVQVLPFRELSQNLVAKLGLRWSPEPCWSAFAKLLRMVRPIDFALWIKLGQKRSLGCHLRMCLIRAGGRTQGIR